MSDWNKEWNEQVLDDLAIVREVEERGAKRERERILKAIEDAPPALDFFGPYISKEKLLEFIKGENK